MSAGFRLPVLNVSVVEWAVEPMLFGATALAFASWYGRYFAERRHAVAIAQSETAKAKRELDTAQNSFRATESTLPVTERRLQQHLSLIDQRGQHHGFDTNSDSNEGWQISPGESADITGETEQRWQALKRTRSDFNTQKAAFEKWSKQHKELTTADRIFGLRAKLLYVYTPFALCCSALVGAALVLFLRAYFHFTLVADG